MRTFPVLFLLSGLLLIGCGSEEAPRPDRPNIVLLFVDDLGDHDVGACGGEIYETPHVDRLAREGMRFTQAYAAAPV